LNLVKKSLESWLYDAQNIIKYIVNIKKVHKTLGEIKDKLARTQRIASDIIKSKDGETVDSLLKDDRVKECHVELKKLKEEVEKQESDYQATLEQYCDDYLKDITKDRYADENILRAYLYTKQKRLIVIRANNNDQKFETSEGLEFVNQPQWEAIYVIHRPGRAIWTATYDKLKLIGTEQERNTDNNSGLLFQKPFALDFSSKTTRERQQLFTGKYKKDQEANELFNKELLKDSNFALGSAFSEGDCFFDSFAQALNIIKGTQYTTKGLRMECYRYYLELNKLYTKTEELEKHWIYVQLAKLVQKESKPQEVDEDGFLKIDHNQNRIIKKIETASDKYLDRV
jgi:hypothetical protein